MKNQGFINRNFVGSSFDDFLREEGLEEAVNAATVKRRLALSLLDEMKKQKLTKSAMAERMGTSRAQIDRLLDPDNESVTLDTLTKAARALGKRVELTLV